MMPPIAPWGYGLMAIAVANLAIQVGLLVTIYRKILRKRTWREVARSRVLVMESVIHLISVALFGFFFARALPIWRATGCFVFHCAVMMLFELQLGLFTYVQFHRYIKSLEQPGFRRMEVCLLAAFALTTVLNGYGQGVMISGKSAAAIESEEVAGTCDFSHNPEIAVTTAVLHAIAEFGFVAYFYRYIDAICMSSQSSNHAQYRRLLQITIGVQTGFALWIILVSAANFAALPMPLLATGYNIHFTLVLLIAGLPHLMRGRGIRPGSSAATNYPAGRAALARPATNAAKDENGAVHLPV